MGTSFYTLVALDPDIATSEALNFAATEPITAVDKDGNEVVNNDDEFKSLFSIDRTGKVTVNKKLDRDKFAVSFTERIQNLLSQIDHRVVLNVR